MEKTFNSTHKKILKHFLTDFPDVNAALNHRDIKKVYRLAEAIIGKSNVWLVSELLVSYGMDPIKELHYVPSYFMTSRETKNFEKIDLSDATSIYPHAFSEANVVEVTGTDNIRFIHTSAFSSSWLAKADFKNVDNLGDRAFAYNINLRELPIQNCKSLVTIPDECFTGCVRLEKIVIPDSVKTIENSAFSFCRQINEVHIPAGIEDISSTAFNMCIRDNLYFPAGEARLKEMKRANPKIFNGTEIKKVIY